MVPAEIFNIWLEIPSGPAAVLDGSEVRSSWTSSLEHLMESRQGTCCVGVELGDTGGIGEKAEMKKEFSKSHLF